MKRRRNPFAVKPSNPRPNTPEWRQCTACAANWKPPRCIKCGSHSSEVIPRRRRLRITPRTSQSSQ